MPALKRMLGSALRVTMVALWVSGGLALAEERATGLDRSGGLPPLPDKARDRQEIEDLEREVDKEQMRNQLKQLRGLQTEDLEKKHDQLERFKDMLTLNSEVRELLLTSPELEPIYRDILESNPGAPSCDCLDRIELQLVSVSRVGAATLSLDGQSGSYRQGEEIGTTACVLGAVAEDDVTVECGPRRCMLSVGGPRDCR